MERQELKKCLVISVEAWASLLLFLEGEGIVHDNDGWNVNFGPFWGYFNAVLILRKIPNYTSLPRLSDTMSVTEFL